MKRQLAIATCGSDYAAYVAAHEIGHWLGLYHPTEQHGDQFDPLADTATCACTECAPETRVSPYSSATYRDYCGMGTEMEPAWCLSAGATCGGGDNLMFWRVQRGISVGRLTAEQSLVMRINPAVKQ